ncbi:MAG: c-type cytochrome [Chloroflexi bacterium]|nr:c-type cytochrome [Chloroflexota bacterium]
MKFKWFALTLFIVSATLVMVATAHAQTGDAARGQKLFAQDCAVCHGDRGQGRVGATLAKDFPGIRVDVLLKDTISNGVQGSVMPAWAKSKGGPLTDAEIDDIVAYIRSLGNIAPTLPPVTLPPTRQPILPTPVATFPPGDSTRGAQVYNANCAVCHGANGEGRVGATLRKDWSGINVMALLDTTISRGVAGSKMPAWAQSNGGPLSNQEISDVAAYILTLKRAGPPIASPPVAPSSDIGGMVALVCGGLVLIIGIVVLVLGLAIARSRK